MLETLQFYPTPGRLARRAWALFKNTNFVRILEPSAGNGDLAKTSPWHNEKYGRAPIDCCEIDITRHPALQDAGMTVVGLDFLTLKDGALYSHIVMNPPFAEGARHVLKAWEILWDGEIVAIVNAETVRNPYSQERAYLGQLIKKYGSVEFMTDAFTDPDTQRKTDVEIALVYLRKEGDMSSDIMGTIVSDLKKDAMTAPGLAGDFREYQELALPVTKVENVVTAFDAAVTTTRAAVFAEARANYYTKMLGETLEVLNGEAKADLNTSRDFVMRELASRYEDLKSRAWTSVLRSSTVLSLLSSAAQRRIESDFETIKNLDFTASNVFGFLKGLAESQGDIQIGMACDVFDLFMRYHTENNGVFYRGWKSNDKHRTCGMRLKTTRIVLPGYKTEGYRRDMNWSAQRVLADIDKVFAMLDGKSTPPQSLEDTFKRDFAALRTGARMSTSYFDVRYYPGAGTIHFFPHDKTLVDRLNRIVGRHRQWLPPTDAQASSTFWQQYEQAEKFDKEVQQVINTQRRSRWGNPAFEITSEYSQNREEASRLIDAAVQTVLEHHGIRTENVLEAQQAAQQQIELLAS